MKVKFTIDTTGLIDSLRDYKKSVRIRTREEFKVAMFDPVINESLELSPKLLGRFDYEMSQFRGVYPEGNDRFSSRIIIDPYNDDKEFSKWLDWNYFKMTGVRIDTKQQYGKQAYYNNFSGEREFFRSSFYEAEPYIHKNIGRFIVKGGL